MRPIRLTVLALAALCSSAAAAPDLPACPPDRDAALWAFMDDALLARYERDPASYYQAVGDRSRLGSMRDVSEAAVDAWTRRQRGLLARLESLDTSGYTEADRIDHDLMRSDLRRSIASARFQPHQTPITAISGPQVWLPQMGQRLPTATREHLAMHLSRLRQIDVVIGDHIDNMRAGIDAGRVMPRVVIEPAVDQALAQASADIREDPTRSPFYAPMRSLDPDDPLAREARTVIAEQIVPVFRDLALFLQNTYLPACRASVAASAGVDGIARYEHALATHTTRPGLSAREIHQIGLDEVERIRAEMMDIIARSDWFGNRGSDTSADAQFDSFTQYLRTDPRFYHTDPDALLAEYRAICKRVDPELVTLFGRLPRLPYGVRRLPRFQEPSAPTAYYYRGDPDAGIPGYFMANASKLDQRPKYEMLALALHEAVPGHHLQNALVLEIEDQHPIRRTMSFTAYGEGWALYAERLGLEMGSGEFGLYEDPYDDFGRLNMEMWRACRLVVDTGIHAFGWSRQDAIDYMTEHTALAPHNIEAEVDRYIGWPGQATAYKIGQLAIMDIRDRAESTLADRFDLRAFHDEILKDGSLPLPVLEAKMDRWIDSRR